MGSGGVFGVESDTGFFSLKPTMSKPMMPRTNPPKNQPTTLRFLELAIIAQPIAQRTQRIRKNSMMTSH
jgi:hypothetical protein